MSATAFDARARTLKRNPVFSTPAAAEGRKRNRKQKQNRNNQQKVFARCAGQIPSCAAFAKDSCNDDPDCVAAATACCDILGACEFAAFVACFDYATPS